MCLFVSVCVSESIKRVALELKSKDALKLSVEILVLLILSIKEPKPNLPEELHLNWVKITLQWLHLSLQVVHLIYSAE